MKDENFSNAAKDMILYLKKIKIPLTQAAIIVEEEAKKEHEILVGRAKYSDVAKGEAMVELDGFTKAIIDKKDGKILGFHIIGPQAPELIQEVVNAMTSGGDIEELNEGIHIHPALSELIPVTVNNVEE